MEIAIPLSTLRQLYLSCQVFIILWYFRGEFLEKLEILDLKKRQSSRTLPLEIAAPDSLLQSIRSTY